MELVYAFVKLRNGKVISKRVPLCATWLYPTIAMLITGILMCLFFTLIS